MKEAMKLHKGMGSVQSGGCRELSCVSRMFLWTQRDAHCMAGGEDCCEIMENPGFNLSTL